MDRRAFIQGIVLALSTAMGSGVVAQTVLPTKSKVVFQVSDGDVAKWNMALFNAKSVQQDLGAGKVDIEIVAYGPGIGMLKADAITSSRVKDATQSGIRVVACETSMKVLKLEKQDMNLAVDYVPGGVVELMQRQAEGWAYIRP